MIENNRGAYQRLRSATENARNIQHLISLTPTVKQLKSGTPRLIYPAGTCLPLVACVHEDVHGRGHGSEQESIVPLPVIVLRGLGPS